MPELSHLTRAIDEARRRNQAKGSLNIAPIIRERARDTVSPERTDGSKSIHIHAARETQNMETAKKPEDTN